MKLRVMGRYDECAAFAAIIRDNVPAKYLRSISDWYPNRGTSTEGRVYIEFDDPTYYSDLPPFPLNVLPEKREGDNIANIAQLLIKIKNSVPAVGTDEGPKIILNKPTFIRIMKAPGYPCYAAKKTIMEKWSSMPDYWNLVSRHATPEEGPEVYFLNVETIDELINQFMPEEAKNNFAAKQIYLKTGRC